jgi:hypothetical protein
VIKGDLKRPQPFALQDLADRGPRGNWHTEQEEPTATGASNLPAVGAQFLRHRVPAVDIGGGDSRGQLALQLPALVEQHAKPGDVSRLQGVGHLLRQGLDAVQAGDDVAV